MKLRRVKISIALAETAITVAVLLGLVCALGANADEDCFAVQCLSDFDKEGVSDGAPDKVAKALADCSKKLRADPSSYLFFKRGRLYQLRADYAVLKTGLDSARADYNKAIADFKTSIAVDKNRPELYGQLGYVHEILGENDKAIQVYSQWPSVLRGRRTNVYLKLGQYQNALDDLNVLIASGCKFKWIFGDRGACYEKLGRYDEAIKDYKTYQSLPRTPIESGEILDIDPIVRCQRLAKQAKNRNAAR